MKRDPAVAGQFYPADPRSLLEEVRSHVETPGRKMRAMGLVSPHAGFMYSGDVAGAVYSRIEIPETLVILGPNHTGYGKPVSLMTEGKWSMPLGDVEIDAELARAILRASPLIHNDATAHLYEHSLETQLPFIQYFRKDFRFVPICLKRLSLRECRQVGQAIVSAAREMERTVLIAASSDMTHYESHESAGRKDRQCIDQILKRDAEGLYETVRRNDISMCGVNPVTVMLMACNDLGAQHAELVQYMTSGEVSGDMERVVGYAGMIVR
ncbi:MAG: AmmeMemoRadiSam system protein B [Nitrospinales bacterium]